MSGNTGDRGGDRGAPAAATGVSPQRRGNRFWALAGLESDDSDDEDGQVAAGSGKEAASPTPSDYVYESLQVGYSEEEIAACINGIVPASDAAWTGLGAADKVEVLRRVVHRRTAPTAMKPWKGPLPKVIYRATAWIRMWSLLTHADSRERLDTGCNRWETIARGIFNRFGWRATNRLGMKSRH